ncbi:FAD-dependent oxidoreductase [Terrabacter sp. Soil810]|uniref:FAD-dependent oxidoreductase n=1 Tax=Terrabacter sp. Soil810 TaxID=1736418 RepID=UPI00070E5993|nr:FAD-dependent oxidoreductase [Terrabacter sp. Soil810]KRF41444.1 fused response regulator/thioredoxin-disulfide reductase [Terrabacter sp. Soil810]
MARPAIITVDDDAPVSAAIARDLRARYGAEHRILRASSGAEALDLVARLVLRGQPLALVASDQRMPGMTGIELLARVRLDVPDAKLLLLTAYADTDVAISAINDIGLDHYLLKPWDPPEDRLYPVVDDLLSDWHNAHPEQTNEVRVVGHRWSDASDLVKTFLANNHVPYVWLDVERDEEGARLRDLADAGPEDLPLVLVPDGDTLRAPTPVAVATALGLRTRAERDLYDLCIVGGGPAGLAAAVYAASEGLSTVIVEHDAPGGQAGQSAAIENYLGFPRGLSGADLAQRAIAQARRFGAEMVLARDVVALEQRGPVRAVRLDGADDIEARSVVLATGVSYRRLEAAGIDALAGRGVHYGSNAGQAAACAGDEVYVVGAANSAGQAVLNLARHARRVTLVVRGESLEASMSQYLVERIRADERIRVLCRTEVVAADGDGHLERLTLSDRHTGAPTEVAADWLFVYIGASPRTDWLGGDVMRDDHGFVVTGHDLVTGPRAHGWTLTRPPFALETSLPGVFAAGDVRSDSMKRVASAVGEGSMSVYFVHRYLATI